MNPYSNDAWNQSDMDPNQADVTNASVPTDDMFLTTSPISNPYNCDALDLPLDIPSNEPTASQDPDCSLLEYMVEQQEEDEVIDTTMDALPTCGHCEEDAEILTNIFYPSCTFQEVEPVPYPVGADGFNIPPSDDFSNYFIDFNQRISVDSPERIAPIILTGLTYVGTELGKAFVTYLSGAITDGSIFPIIGKAGKWLSQNVFQKLFTANSGSATTTPASLVQMSAEQSKAFTTEIVGAAIQQVAIADLTGIQGALQEFVNITANNQPISPVIARQLIQYGLTCANGPLREASVDCTAIPTDIANNPLYTKASRIVRYDMGAVVAATNITMASKVASIQGLGYNIQLLPIFTAAATAHISFLYDVVTKGKELGLSDADINLFRMRLKDKIKDYSNYCISTYQTKFNALYAAKVPQNELLDFRNLMVLQVLDQVSAWYFLKFPKFSVRSSMNLYIIPTMLGLPGRKDPAVIDRRAVNGNWAVINQILQGIPNKVVKGYNGSWYIQEGQTTVSTAAVYQAVSRLQTTYVGGEQSGFLGRLDWPATSGDYKFQNIGFSYNLPDYQALTFPWYKIVNAVGGLGGKSATNYTTLFDTVNAYGIRNSIDQNLLLSITNNEPRIEFPNWRVTNLSAIPDIGPNAELSRTIADATRDIVTVLPIKVPVVVMSRPNISRETVSPTGSIIHVLPTDATGTGIGCNLPQLQFGNHVSPGLDFTNTFKIAEQSACNGDSISFKGGNGAVRYEFQPASYKSQTYRAVIKVGVKAGSPILGSNVRFQLTVTSPSGVAIDNETFIVNPSTPTDGINDNGIQFVTLISNDTFSVDDSGLAHVDVKVSGIQSGDDVRLAGVYMVVGDQPILNI